MEFYKIRALMNQFKTLIISQNLTAGTSVTALKYVLALPLTLALALATTACSKPSFEAVGNTKTEVPEPQPQPGPTPNPPPASTVTEYFSQSETSNKVDILIIDDNSQSMESKQRRMGSRFANFISGIKDLDYQIGITTTDVSGPTGSGWATDGRLVEYKGTSIKYLTPSTPNAQQLFLETIRRDETLGCTDRTRFPYCPSSVEEPLKATIMAIDERDRANSGFFRNGADLVVVVLSDEDEMSEGDSPSMTRPRTVINAFEAAFGKSKRFMAHGIVIQPKDFTCLNEQRREAGVGYYGHQVNDLALLTGGRTYSICDADYGKHLSSISNDVRRLLSSFELKSEPIPNSVKVTTLPATSIKWRVEGKLVVFDSPPPSGSRVEVTYVAK